MRVKRWISDLQTRQGFHPTLTGVFVNPFYFARHGLDDGIRLGAGQLRRRLPDVGCGSKPYAQYFPVDEIRRVLKPKGILLITIPFAWVEHEQPHDCAVLPPSDDLFLDQPAIAMRVE